MWDIKLKATHEQTRKTKTHRHRQQYGGYQKEGGWGSSKGLIGVKCIGMEKDLTLGGGHTVQYTHDILQNCTLGTYIILLTNVTPVNVIEIYC